mmetsp:Transcript_12790/g.37533  ORF Transcript_12790/g.37533 Transcript_12790/m.37533 type:complete len:696 (+) Transcript_12790:156-2243(+)
MDPLVLCAMAHDAPLPADDAAMEAVLDTLHPLGASLHPSLYRALNAMCALRGGVSPAGNIVELCAAYDAAGVAWRAGRLRPERCIDLLQHLVHVVRNHARPCADEPDEDVPVLGESPHPRPDYFVPPIDLARLRDEALAQWTCVPGTPAVYDRGSRRGLVEVDAAAEHVASLPRDPDLALEHIARAFLCCGGFVRVSPAARALCREARAADLHFNRLLPYRHAVLEHVTRALTRAPPDPHDAHTVLHQMRCVAAPFLRTTSARAREPAPEENLFEALSLSPVRILARSVPGGLYVGCSQCDMGMLVSSSTGKNLHFCYSVIGANHARTHADEDVALRVCARCGLCAPDSGEHEWDACAEVSAPRPCPGPQGRRARDAFPPPVFDGIAHYASDPHVLLRPHLPRTPLELVRRALHVCARIAEEGVYLASTFDARPAAAEEDALDLGLFRRDLGDHLDGDGARAEAYRARKLAEHMYEWTPALRLLDDAATFVVDVGREALPLPVGTAAEQYELLRRGRYRCALLSEPLPDAHFAGEARATDAFEAARGFLRIANLAFAPADCIRECRALTQAFRIAARGTCPANALLWAVAYENGLHEVRFDMSALLRTRAPDPAHDEARLLAAELRMRAGPMNLVEVAGKVERAEAVAAFAGMRAGERNTCAKLLPGASDAKRDAKSLRAEGLLAGAPPPAKRKK